MPHTAEQVNHLNGKKFSKVYSIDKSKLDDQMERLRTPLFYHPVSNRTKAAKILLKQIGGLLALQGWCIASQNRLAKDMSKFGYDKDLNIRQIRNVTKELADAGLVTYRRRSHDRSIYVYKLTEKGQKAYEYFVKKDPLWEGVRAGKKAFMEAKKIAGSPQKNCRFTPTPDPGGSKGTEKKLPVDISYINNINKNSSFSSISGIQISGTRSAYKDLTLKEMQVNEQELKAAIARTREIGDDRYEMAKPNEKVDPAEQLIADMASTDDIRMREFIGRCLDRIKGTSL